MLIACLKHYCDMIWEYDRESEKIIIHYDVTAQKYAGRSYTVPEIIGIFRDEFGICVNGRIWKKYLNAEYLKSFFETDKDGEELELQIMFPSAPLKWYRIRIEKTDCDRLIISGRDMYNEFKERSLYHSVRESFDNIISISLETETCVVIHARNMAGVPKNDSDYNSLMRLFTERYVPEEDRERVRAELELNYAVKKLESAAEYIIYVNTVSDNQKGCKKITFSYADKARKFITFTTLNISEIVGRFEYLKRYARQKERRKRAAHTAYSQNNRNAA